MSKWQMFIFVLKLSDDAQWIIIVSPALWLWRATRGQLPDERLRRLTWSESAQLTFLIVTLTGVSSFSSATVEFWVGFWFVDTVFFLVRRRQLEFFIVIKHTFSETLCLYLHWHKPTRRSQKYGGKKFSILSEFCLSSVTNFVRAKFQFLLFRSHSF